MIGAKQALFSMLFVSMLVFVGLVVFSQTLSRTMRSGIDEGLINIATQNRLVVEEKLKGRFAGLEMLASITGMPHDRETVVASIVQQNESLRQYRKLGAVSVLGEHFLVISSMKASTLCCSIPSVARSW